MIWIRAAADPALAQSVLQNPFQRGCDGRRRARLRNVKLFNNGFNARPARETAVQAGLGRNDRRTIVGGRWEHDFDNTTTWRNQFVFDDRNISQPTGRPARSAISRPITS